MTRRKAVIEKANPDELQCWLVADAAGLIVNAIVLPSGNPDGFSPGDGLALVAMPSSDIVPGIGWTLNQDGSWSSPQA
ncbi:MAG TPA: hypothetical protein VHW02_07925 [Rhizomicrobium sp.]|jgi:hypothetical protein|nr:hypothetical protein [Rhizomicrobium sp.]